MFLYFRDLRISVRTLGLPDLKREVAQGYIEKALKIISQFEAESKLYVELISTQEEKDLYASLNKEWEDFKVMGGKLIKAYETNDMETVRNIILVDCPKAADQFTHAIEKLNKFQNAESQNFVATAKDLNKTMNILNIAIIAFGVFLGMGVGILFSNNIVQKFTSITQNLLSSSTETSEASGNLSTSSTQLSQNSTESAASLEETVASLEQLTAMVKLNSDHAKEANGLSQESLKAAEEGKTEITRLIEAMSEMAVSSKKIEEIINVIDDIAFQTNLLALNAAVEAARAGEQGRGFAVVAEAVRTLAQRSAVAAKDINQLIKENVEKTQESSHIANTSGEVLLTIVKSVEKVATLNLEIASASKEQSTGLEQISHAMNQLETATQNNVETSQNVANFAEKMSEQSLSLVELADDLNHLIHAKKQKIA